MNLSYDLLYGNQYGDSSLRNNILSASEKRSISEENILKYNTLKTLSKKFLDLIIVYHDNNGSFNSMMEFSGESYYINCMLTHGKIKNLNKNYMTLHGLPQFWQIENIVDAVPFEIVENNSTIPGRIRGLSTMYSGSNLFKICSVNSHLEKKESLMTGCNPLQAYVDLLVRSNSNGDNPMDYNIITIEDTKEHFPHWIDKMKQIKNPLKQSPF